MNSKRCSFHKASGNFESYLMRNGKKLYIGLFPSKLEAQAASVGAEKVLAKCGK